MIAINNSIQVTCQNLKAYSGPGPFFVGAGDECINLLGCETRILPGRWHAVNRDGAIFANHRIGPWIENCVFEGLGDDGVNLHSSPIDIRERFDERSFALAARMSDDGTGPPIAAEPGDRLAILHSASGALAAMPVLAETRLLPGALLATFAEPVAALGGNASLDQYMAFNEDVSCPFFVIRGNTFRFVRRWGVVAMSRGGLIENNLFESISASAIALQNIHDPGGFHSGPAPRDISIRRNVFRDCVVQNVLGTPFETLNPSIIALSLLAEGGQPAQWRGIRGILIEENEFFDWRRAGAISIRNAENVAVRRNRFAEDGEGRSDVEPVRILDKSNVESD
ncbi:MAG: hypothetical protein BWZ10_01800 [candidate division BRC1 bacterium ADurb.BinA364]|nr:MAG: hypothetical protein BWZ10_01800 [candidate division BRC1 bacterium ADurb.BinA364]